MALTPQQLDRIASTPEVRVETRDGERTRQTIIWVVVADGEVYVRSVRGQTGRWYRQALANPEVALLVGGDRYRFTAVPAADDDSVNRTSEGIKLKYGTGRSVDAMIQPEVLDTTLRLVPTD